jgi:hypothetical protein
MSGRFQGGRSSAFRKPVRPLGGVPDTPEVTKSDCTIAHTFHTLTVTRRRDMQFSICRTDDRSPMAHRHSGAAAAETINDSIKRGSSCANLPVICHHHGQIHHPAPRPTGFDQTALAPVTARHTMRNPPVADCATLNIVGGTPNAPGSGSKSDAPRRWRRVFVCLQAVSR